MCSYLFLWGVVGEVSLLSELLFQEPKAEPEPLELFIRSRNRNGNRTLLLKLRRQTKITKLTPPGIPRCNVILKQTTTHDS